MSLRGAKKLRPCVLAFVLAVGMSVDLPASATDTGSENAHLAAAMRQLELLDRLVDQSAQVAPSGSRYHFDYERLHADIARVRAGIQDYLSPGRAQPRDTEMLGGKYQREKGTTP